MTSLTCRLHHRYRPRWIGTLAVLACHDCGRTR